jgi:two-component system phosphate regulon sensor histidine kinase PhoR
MTVLVCAALLIVVVVLLLQLRKLRVFIFQLREAAEGKRSLLLEEEEGGLPGHGVDRLVAAFNELVEDNARHSDRGQGYLDQIQTTLGNLREAVVIVDSDNAVRLANQAFQKLVGMEAAPLDVRLETLIQGAAFQEFLFQTRQGREGRRSELESIVNKKALWLEVSVAPLPQNQRSHGNYMLFVFHDITRQKGLERMRTEFVANVSHELRTPVTIIKGFAETLIDDYDLLSREEKGRFLRKINANSERLSNLLQDLLLLSRLESADSVLYRERLSISEQLRDIIENWRSVLDDPSKVIATSFYEGNDTAFVDPLRFSQIITNLLENTRRHAHGFTRIDVRSTPVEGGVEIQIEDNGCGIPSKDLPFIFQRFYRVDKGRSRESGGTGLGLSIVKHIVQQHEGTIEAQSQPGQGTRIDVFIPYAETIAESAVLSSVRRKEGGIRT